MMKQSNQIGIKGQVFLMVFLLLLLAGTLAAALAITWESTLQTNALERDGLRAFYLAEAGIERAKIAILYDVNLTGWQPGPTNNDWYLDLDIAGDGYTFRYKFNIVASGTERTITSRGQVLDNQSNLLAEKQIEVRVGGIEDTTPPLDGVDDDLSGSKIAGSWQEI